ncbi:MAG: iron complex outermembrane receptor protein [bacterium]|jgi:iron complex outermembrane receptor protein
MNHHQIKLPLSILASLLVTSNVYAQEQTDDESSSYEVISVTAQKRAQSIQDVPISMSAFGEEVLDNIGAQDFSDLTAVVPGLSIVGGSDAFPITYIRGIGTNDTSIGADPSIGVYVDGVYASRLGGALTELLDVERVEILKGPQGTLFGRNSIGGAISIITNKPSDIFEGRFKLSVGNFGNKKASAVINIPLMDEVLYARTYGSITKSDGWQENILNGINGYQEDRVNGGFKLTWMPSDKVEVNFSNTWSSYNDIASYVEVYTSAFPLNPLSDVLDDKKAVTGGLDPFGNTANDQAPNIPVYDRVLREHWLNVAWDMGDDLSLTSLSTFRKYTATSAREYDGTEFFLAENTQSIEASESYGQEFRLSHDSDGLFWVLGASYNHEDADLDFTLGLADLTFALNGGAPYYERSITASETDSYAVFGDATISLLDKMNLTVGARFSRDDKVFSYSNGLHEYGAAALGGFGASFPASFQFVDENGIYDPTATQVEDSWSDFSPRVVLDYKLGSHLLYTSVTKGYKSGAFNSFPSPDSTNGLVVTPEATRTVAPETVINYELGFKSSLLNRNLNINGSFYYQDYQDLQVFQVVGGVTRLENAGEAKSSGLELDGRYAINNELALMFNAAWMEAEFKDYVVSGDDLSGTSLFFAPELSASLSVDYVKSLSGIGDARAFITYAYKGDHLLAAGVEQSSYSLLNAKFSLISEDDTWEVALYGNNLTDEAYLTNFVGILIDFGFTGAVRNTPRTYGMSFSYNF